MTSEKPQEHTTKKQENSLVSTQEQTPEDTELKQLLGDSRLANSPKFARWVELFTDKTNAHELNTFGNQVQSAIHAYQLDPVKQYSSAGVIGHENLKKLKSAASSYYEKRGLTYGKMLDIAMKKMLNSSSPAWWSIVAELMEIKSADNGITINQTQINNTQINEAERVDYNKDFAEFLEGKK